MNTRFTPEQLDQCSHQEMSAIILSLQEQLDKMNENYEKMIEQIRVANANLYGRKTKKLDVLEGQISFFNEAEALSEEPVGEPEYEEVVRTVKKKKKKGQRDADLAGLEEEEILHSVSEAELDAAFGKGNWRRLPDETFKRLRFTPASWTVEVHTVEVYVGTDGVHQDEFLRGNRDKDLLRNSIVTPSLEAAIMNAKYVNSAPLYRIEQEFMRNGVFLSRQNMADWTIKCAQWYLKPMYDLLHKELLACHVNQSDETPVTVIHKETERRSCCYMWVHRSGEFYKDKPIVLYEYQESRSHVHPMEFYRDFHGILVSDSLQQYHMLEKELPGLTSANCWAHARRSYADAVKAVGTKNQKAVRASIAYQALARIGAFYKLEESFQGLSPEERLEKRRISTKPLVDEYFAWVKSVLADTQVLPKGKTAEGLKFSVNQEKYLRVFLSDGEVPIDNSAAERAIRTFCVGKKNWVLINSAKGANASAVIYSITETAKLNNLNPYYYLEYLLTELPKYAEWDKEKKANVVNPEIELDYLLPWSDTLPEKCYKPRRK